jgi:O-antigen ligase
VSASAPPTARAAPPSHGPARSWIFAACLGALTLLTLAGIIGSNGNLAVALAPAAIFAILYAIAKIPLRYSALTLAMLALTLENPGEAPACGMWKSPLYTLGAMLLVHLNQTLPIKGLIFSGVELVFFYFFLLIAYRRFSQARGLHTGRDTARPMRVFALVCMAGAGWIWIYGALRGDFNFAFSLWQMQRIIYLPIVVVLCQEMLTTRRDAVAYGKIILVAACIKALLAIYIRQTVSPPPGESTLQYATTHADSMLFADAVCILAVLLFEQYSKRTLRYALTILPLLIWGMVANTRRLVWVEVIVGLVTVFFASRPTRMKRFVARGFIFAAPLLLVYTVTGWNAGGGIFRPVQTIRSVVDSSTDASTRWRDWENYNLFYTVKQTPFLGTGYGHGYIEKIKLPDISRGYSLYRYIPHNSILGLWAYGGFVGFTMLWLMIAVGIFLAARAYRSATHPADRTILLSSLVAIVVYLTHCYGDMGLGTWTAVFTVGPALACSSRLAVTTGAWVGGRPRRTLHVEVSAHAPSPGPVFELGS